MDNSGGADSRQRFDFLCDLFGQARSSLIISRKEQTHCERLLRLKTQTDLEQMGETSEQESGAYQENDCQRYFHDNQGTTKAIVALIS